MRFYCPIRLTGLVLFSCWKSLEVRISGIGVDLFSFVDLVLERMIFACRASVCG